VLDDLLKGTHSACGCADDNEVKIRHWSDVARSGTYPRYSRIRVLV
jgi:hypothetical protein